MSSTPVLFPNGISTFPSNHIIATYPVTPTQWQVNHGDDFFPYEANNYTVTTGGTGAGVTIQNWNTGGARFTAGTTTPFQALIATPVQSMLFAPGNALWHDVRMACPTGSMTNPATDAALYCGLFDNVVPTSASNGVYFVKPAGGSAVNFVILKGGVSTTFQNVADMAQPSGLYADPFGVPAVVTANATGTTLTSLTIATAGFGYRSAPFVAVNGTAGSGALAYLQLGSSSGFPTISGQGAGSGLAATQIMAAGSGYTAGTFTLDILPMINFQFYYNGKGRLTVGINSRTVMALDVASTNPVVPGATVNLATSTLRNFNFQGTTVTTLTPTPPSGDPIVALPLNYLNQCSGLIGTTANARYAIIDELNLAGELN